MQDSPSAFGSTVEGALERGFDSWQEQIDSTVRGADRNTQLAFSDDSCVGIASVYRQDDSSVGELLQMWVAPEFRGSEVASQLVSNLIDWACESGFKELVLSVTDSNERAIHFYEKVGFATSRKRVEIDSDRGLFGREMVRPLEVL